jgi:diadenosine tetraphosphate (Ap4A) HIT family hydrolase
MIRDTNGRLAAIVEDKDLAPEQHSIDEINSGIYAFQTIDLMSVLFELSDDNRQRELYLTDTITNLRQRGRPVGTYTLSDPLEISGINTPEQLAEAAAVLARRRASGDEDCRVCSLLGSVGPGAFPSLLARAGAVLAVATSPYNSGQLVVHPRRHVIRHASLDQGERADLWELAQIGSRAIQEVYHPAGMNLGYTAGEAGRHLALQVIPRWVGDTNFLPILAEKTLLPEALDQTHARLLSELRAAGHKP